MAVILVVQHDGDCPPALLGGWLADAGVELDVRRPYAGDALPSPDELDTVGGLLVLGGPMGAGDVDQHPWLGEVQVLVREAAVTELPTLGVCLGHQLIAAALDGTVERNPRGQQLGLLDVGWNDAAASDELFAAQPLPARGVQWNNDLVVTLPHDAVELAATPAGETQVVRFGRRMWGVQLHPEADLEVVEAWAASDWGSHQARGRDQVALLGAIDAARVELDEAWRPVAEAFAALVRAREATPGGDGRP